MEKKEGFAVSNFFANNTPKWAQILGDIAMVGCVAVPMLGEAAIIAVPVAMKLTSVLGIMKMVSKMFGAKEKQPEVE